MTVATPLPELLYDAAALRARVDSDADLLLELVGLFLEDAPALLEAVRAAVEVGDSPALQAAAHTLKGSVSNFCAASLYEVAGALERLGRDGDLAGAEAVLTPLEAAVERLTAELGQLAATLDEGGLMIGCGREVAR